MIEIFQTVQKLSPFLLTGHGHAYQSLSCETAVKKRNPWDKLPVLQKWSSSCQQTLYAHLFKILECYFVTYTQQTIRQMIVHFRDIWLVELIFWLFWDYHFVSSEFEWTELLYSSVQTSKVSFTTHRRHTPKHNIERPVEHEIIETVKNFHETQMV